MTQLDMASIKELAEVHQLTRKILASSFFWNNLVRKTFPEGANIEVDHEHLPSEDDPHSALVKPKVKLLSQIMNVIEDS